MAWWTFQAVSLPPSVRNLFNEDQAIAAASATPGEGERQQQEQENLPPPPGEHAPEVASLLVRLQGLPPLPYLLEVALQRDAVTPQGEAPMTWNAPERQALQEAQQALRGAWEPFFLGSAPNWKNYPDSILLFRSRDFPMRYGAGKYGELLNYIPGRGTNAFTMEGMEFFVSYARQTRGLGAIRFGWALNSWNQSETIRTADFTTKLITRGILQEDYPLEFLRQFALSLPPAPTLEDLRQGLEGDRSLFLRAAGFLESLPSTTSARSGLVRLLQDEKDAEWFYRQMNQPPSAKELGALLRRDAIQLDLLREKTFLPAPAWRQWLSGNPGAGLSSALANGLDGFKDFEKTRTAYLFAQAALQARLALAQGGIEAARRVPDPTRPGSFLKVEKTPEGFQVTAFSARPEETNGLSLRLPFSAAPKP